MQELTIHPMFINCLYLLIYFQEIKFTLNSQMNLLFKLFVLTVLILRFVDCYNFTVTPDSLVINVLTGYTFNFLFPDTTTRNVTLNFPPTSDLSSPSLTISINGGAALASSSYTVDNSIKRITINNINPILSGTINTLNIRLTNIQNPSSAIQFSFVTSIVPPATLFPTSVPFINYENGNFLSCVWKFDKFTGSTGSTAEITVVLGNKLLIGTNLIQINYPNLYEDSDSLYLTLNSSPTVTYSIDDGATYLTPLSFTVSSIRINFGVVLNAQIPSGRSFKIKISGIQNPPTTNPSGRGFTVQTSDSNSKLIDRISQCLIDPLAVLQIPGTFDQSSLYINDPYINPKIIVNSVIPFTIFQNDILQMDFNQALKITNSTTLQISITRGSPFVSFYSDATNPSTPTTSYFKGNIENSNSGNAYSEIQMKFTINAPNSQIPWDFAIWLKRPSGAYVKIKATLRAIAIPINSGNVTITPQFTEMAIQSQYTLSVKLQRAISRNGKIMLGFNPDFKIIAGPCTGTINGLQVTSTSTCQLVTRSGTPFLSFKINDALSSVIDVGSTITIQFSSQTIRNPLYPNIYTFQLYLYYNQFDQSLVAQAAIIGNVQMTKHFSFNGGLLTNDFIVYQMAQLTITYTNDVFIPENTALQFILPSAVGSFDFVGNISINNVNVTNAILEKSLAGAKTGQVTIRQPISPGTTWQIPLLVRMPNIAGDYPSITFKLIKQTQIYEQVNSGLRIRVRFPSPELTAAIEPKTNRTIDAVTDYQLKLVSGVPLASSFFVILTTPAEIQIGTTTPTCSATTGSCSNIQKISNSVFNLTYINSPYSPTTTPQQFLFTINPLINPRFEGNSSQWKVQLKGIYDGGLADISEDYVMSSTFVHSTSLECNFDTSKQYFKGNTATVVILCTFVNNLIQGDYAQLTFTSNSYQLNTGTTFACSSPSQTNAVQCDKIYSSGTTLKLGVTILTSFTSNKNKLTLQVSGLISYPSTTYYDPPAAVLISRFDGQGRIIDTDSFNYDINCNENATIIAKSCKTCLNALCTSCHTSLYLAVNGTCVRDCASDTQFRSLNNPNTSQCQPCSPPCYTCENSSTTCLSCINSSYYLYRSTHTCQLTCDTSSLYWVNTVAMPGQKICDSCLSECRICVNNSLNGCLQCQTSYVLQNGVCRSNCLDPSSYIYQGQCVKCNSACSTCSGGGANNCINCKDLFYLNSGYCVAECPSNKYPLGNWTCGCESNCKLCTNTSSTFCTQCKDPTHFILNGTCLASCPSNTILIGNQCVQCPDNCIQCNTSTSCLKCASSYHYYEGKCYFDCNTISLQHDAKGSICVLCPTGCDTCADNVCYTCLEGYSKNETQCIKSCILTDSCAVESPVPDVVTPLPATIVFFVWICVVLIAKFFNPKLYPPYAIIFFTAAIQICLILGTAIHTGQLPSQVVKRLLQTDLTQRPVILNLLIVAISLNYLTNIIFAIIFWKYIYPLIKDPRQVDYITIGVVFILGMLTNYRFTLIMFSKMFPKPHIHIQYSSRLTPVHYMCIASIFLSVFALAAAGMMLKNQYPLTDLFMLGIDIIIIEAILIIISIWMVAVNKDESYFESDTKKYHLEQNERTQGNMFQNTDQKNHMQIRDQFAITEGQLQQDHLRDSTHSNYRRLNTKTTFIKGKKMNEASDFEQPLQKFSQSTTKINHQKPNSSATKNQIHNSFDTDITTVNKNKKQKPASQQDNQQLKNKIKQIDSERKKTTSGNIFDSSQKKFETQDEDLTPNKNGKKQNQNILVDIEQPESQQIPNLPLTTSVFHERASSQFGQKIKSKANQQRSQTNLVKKSPIKSNKTLKPAQLISKTEARPNMMKKKNKFLESEVQSDAMAYHNKSSPKKKKDDEQINQVDIESIIKSKIIVIESKDENKIANTTLGDPNNISSIDKKDEQNSDFNQQVSPSWFNIQNQRFDFSQMGSQFSDN